MGLDRARHAHGITEGVEAALVRDGLTVEQAPEQRHGLDEPVQALAEAAPEVEPEGVVLALEPAGPKTEDQAPADTWSTVVAILASRPGLRNVFAVTMCPGAPAT